MTSFQGHFNVLIWILHTDSIEQNSIEKMSFLAPHQQTTNKIKMVIGKLKLTGAVK